MGGAATPGHSETVAGASAASVVADNKAVGKPAVVAAGAAGAEAVELQEAESGGCAAVPQDSAAGLGVLEGHHEPRRLNSIRWRAPVACSCLQHTRAATVPPALHYPVCLHSKGCPQRAPQQQ